MTDIRQWQHAYAKQAEADMSAYYVLRQRALLKRRTVRCDSALLKQIKNLCRETELLAPTVDSQRRPDNCEYPWEDGAGVVVVPAEHSFPAWSLLSQAAGQELLKIIPFAISALL